MLREWAKIKFLYIRALIVAVLKREKIEVKKNKQAFVMLAAEYNNLGDIAITYAQERFLKEHLPNDYEVIVIPYHKTFRVYFSMKKIVNKDTIITLIGGGNAGTLYEFIEYPRRFILKKFRKNKIISFPQSVYYGNSKKYVQYKKEFVKLCKKCDKLTLVAREKLSYERYKKMLGDTIDILLVPDIVFSLDMSTEDEREGASIILRDDKEKSKDTQKQSQVLKYVKTHFDKVSYNDTCDVCISGNGYKEFFEYVLNLSRKEFAITDRLHGMILSYITITPCLSFDNNNHKIKSTYDTWLYDQDLIKMYEKDTFKEIDTYGNRKSLNKYFISLTSKLEEYQKEN